MQSIRSLVLDRGQYTTMTIKLTGGGAITSWRIENVEQIFVSKLSRFTPYHEVKGGLKLMFPKIGEWQFGPTNGFASTCCWQIQEQPHETANGDISVMLVLYNDALTESYQNFRFMVNMEIVLSEKSFSVRYKIENTSEHAIYIESMLECYFNVKNRQNCQWRVDKWGENLSTYSGDIYKMDDSLEVIEKKCIDHYCSDTCLVYFTNSIHIEGVANNNNTLKIDMLNSTYFSMEDDSSNDDFDKDERNTYIHIKLGELKPVKLVKNKCHCYHFSFEVQSPSILIASLQKYRDHIGLYC